MHAPVLANGHICASLASPTRTMRPGLLLPHPRAPLKNEETQSRKCHLRIFRRTASGWRMSGSGALARASDCGKAPDLHGDCMLRQKCAHNPDERRAHRPAHLAEAWLSFCCRANQQFYAKCICFDCVRGAGNPAALGTSTYGHVTQRVDRMRDARAIGRTSCQARAGG